MRRYMIVIAATSLLAGEATASCTPDPEEAQVNCFSCGNLEQNPERGFDLAHREFLSNGDLRNEIRWTGNTEVNLLNPPHSSPGVLWYRVNMTDPTWSVTNVGAYSQAQTFQQELAMGYETSMSSGLGQLFGFQTEAQWRTTFTNQMELLYSVAVTYANEPYEFFLEDQNGNEFAEKEIRRNGGMPTPDVVGPSDLNPDERYRERHCEDEDPRQVSSGGSNDMGFAPPEPYGDVTGQIAFSAAIWGSSASECWAFVTYENGQATAITFSPGCY